MIRAQYKYLIMTGCRITSNNNVIYTDYVSNIRYIEVLSVGYDKVYARYCIETKTLKPYELGIV
jgi:hypothetical protein